MSNVVVLGASAKPERYANQAVRLLVKHGHTVIPVHPATQTIEGLPVVARLEDVNETVDTLTVYVGPDISTRMQQAIVNLGSVRVIFNPGTENPKLATKLAAAGIHVETACTLVLLRTDQF
jgi:predicted CoA-binding protein